MVIPLNVATASAMRSSSSFSSSSSDQSCSGFLAPPLSTFLVTSLHIVSRSRLRAEPPGCASQYCLTSTALNPPTPPKYPNTRSTNSAVCGMLEPPFVTACVNMSTPARSTRSRAALRLALALALAIFFALEMHSRHSPVKYP